MTKPIRWCISRIVEISLSIRQSLVFKRDQMRWPPQWPLSDLSTCLSHCLSINLWNIWKSLELVLFWLQHIFSFKLRLLSKQRCCPFYLQTRSITRHHNHLIPFLEYLAVLLCSPFETIPNRNFRFSKSKLLFFK